MQLFRNALIAALFLCTMQTPAPTAALCGWSVSAVPTVPGAQTILHGVSAISSTDIWAVGYWHTSSSDRAIAEHFNGSGWSFSALPTVAQSHLLAIRGTAANDIWAVGSYDSGGRGFPLALHWNGASWRVFAVPSPSGATDIDLYSLAAISANDVWAAGYATVGTRKLAVTEHWNGLRWNLITTPQPNGEENVLYTIAANRSTNVWALGNQGQYRSTTNPRRNLALHWNGAAWSVIPTVNAGSVTSVNYFYASAFVPGTDNLWGVGQYETPHAFYTMTAFWNGARWSLAASPNTQVNGDFLLGVVARTTGDVFSVGTNYDSSLIRRNFSIRWNGTSWNPVSLPNMNTNHNELFDIQLIPGSQAAIAVGDYFASATDRRTLIARSCSV